MKDRSPTIPPCTCASATPKAPLIAQTPMKVPIPPFPDVAKSNYGSKTKKKRIET
jgi:hypothetical protein